jgi:hypothetical protein
MSDTAPAAPAAAPESAPVQAFDAKDTPTAPGSEQAMAWADNGDDDFGGDYVARAMAAVRSDAPVEKDAAGDPITLGEPPVAEEAPVAQDAQQAPEAPKVPDEDKPKSAAWAELHKEKKAVFAERQAMKAEQARVKARDAEFEAAKDDKVAALKLLGYEDPKAFLEEIADTGGKLTAEGKIARQVQKELAELKAERAAEIAERTKSEDAKAYQAGVDNHMKNIDSVIKSDPKLSKSLVALDGGKEAILEVMRDHYAKTAQDGAEGEVMPYAKAAEIVDNNYKKQIDGLLANDVFREYVSSKLGASAKLPQKPNVAAVSQKPAQPVQPTRGEPEDDINKRLEEATRFLQQKTKQRVAR